MKKVTRKKPTLVELVAQVIAIQKERKLKPSDMFWKKHLRQAEAAVYCVSMALENRTLVSGFGFERKAKRRSGGQGE